MHEALIKVLLGDALIGHISRDGTATQREFLPMNCNGSPEWKQLIANRDCKRVDHRLDEDDRRPRCGVEYGGLAGKQRRRQLQRIGGVSKLIQN